MAMWRGGMGGIPCHCISGGLIVSRLGVHGGRGVFTVLPAVFASDRAFLQGNMMSARRDYKTLLACLEAMCVEGKPTPLPPRLRLTQSAADAHSRAARVGVCSVHV